MAARRKKFKVDFPSDGRVYVIDSDHQFFNGHIYKKNRRGDYFVDLDKVRHRLHTDVYEFHNGKIPKGYIIHHNHRRPDGSFDTDENNIEWLEMMTQSDHASFHSQNNAPLEKICDWCGTPFTTTVHQKKYCSDTCRNAVAAYKLKKKWRGEIVKDSPAVEVLPAAPADVDSDESNMEVRNCPICFKPFRVKTYSRQVTCGDRKCSLVSLRISRAKTTIEKRIKERNKGAALFISKELGVKIRYLLINGEPWFIAKDVCDALGLTNSRKAVARLDDDEKRLINVADNTVTTSDGIQEVGKRGNPNMYIVNEFGLYRLILESRKPTAKLFKHWIIHEVLPRLRKMSMYLSPAEAPALPEPTIDQPAQLTLNITPTDQSK